MPPRSGSPCWVPPGLPSRCCDWPARLEVLGPRLPAPEAERVAERVVERLFEAVPSAGDPDDLRYLAEAMKTVVPRMSSEAAAAPLGG